MTAEQMAEQTLKQFGLPKSEDLYRAILEMVFIRGKIDGANQLHERQRQALFPTLSVVK